MITLPVLHEERHHAAIVHCELGADQRTQTCATRGGIEPGRGADIIAIQYRECWQTEPSRFFGELLRHRSAAQKTERTRRVKFDVIVNHDPK